MILKAKKYTKRETETRSERDKYKGFRTQKCFYDVDVLVAAGLCKYDFAHDKDLFLR